MYALDKSRYVLYRLHTTCDLLVFLAGMPMYYVNRHFT